MDMHVRIELFGGPEDGREITIPVGSEGAPISPLPVPSPAQSAELADPACYEKDYQRPTGVWVYKYTTARSVHRA